jgi:hypothetical protein
MGRFERSIWALASANGVRTVGRGGTTFCKIASSICVQTMSLQNKDCIGLRAGVA